MTKLNLKAAKRRIIDAGEGEEKIIVFPGDNDPDNLDRRPRQLIAEHVPNLHDLASRIQNRFASEGLSSDDKVSVAVTKVLEIHGRFSEIAGKSVEIGILLAQMEDELGGARLRLLENDQGILPFSKSTASKLRAIGRSVIAGDVPPDMLPPYTIAYDLVRLPPPDRQRAMQEGLMRPDVSRKEVAAFVRRLRDETGDTILTVDEDDRAIRRRLRDLRRRKAILQSEIEGIESEIGRIEAKRAGNGRGNTEE